MSSSTTGDGRPVERGVVPSERLASDPRPQDRAAVTGEVVRYAVVRRFRVGAGKTWLQVESAVRDHTWLAFDCLPDHASADLLLASGRKTLAIKLVTCGGGEADCTVLCTSPLGPARHNISLGLALALCIDGRHTVVTRPGL